MKRADMVRYGAEQLLSAENAIETALCEATALTSKLGRMRMESRLSMVVGQDAMGALVEAINALTHARGAMVRAHGHLDDVKTQIGCRTLLSGTMGSKDESGKELGIGGVALPAA